jgi:peptidyl-prolyl cis-trans isomerase A (cyclophilin A)
LPGYVAQFGVSSDPKLNKQWVYCDTTDEEAKRNCRPGLPDEPRTQPNKKGTLSFASSGKNSRKTQIFINLANNDGPPNFLDAQNFVPFARIVRGMEPENNIPKRLNGEYGGKVNQGKAAYYGGEYFEAVFPKLSVIRDAKIL